MNDPEFSPGIVQAKYCKPEFGLTDLKSNYALIDELGKETYKKWEATDYSNAMEPSIWTTKEENDLISQIKTDLKTGMAEYKDKFMMGVLDPKDNAVWAEYTSKLEKLRAKELETVYNNACQRFLKRAGK
jgi:hypothetical protein